MVGFRLTPLKVEASTVRVAVCFKPARLAVIVAVVVASTPVVLTVNAAEVAPPATVTVPGTDAEVEELERDTGRPAVGAGPDTVTVPVEVVPAGTEVGFRTRDTRAGAVTVSVAA